MSGDNAAQNAARDTPVDSNAAVHSIDEQGQDQDEDQDQAVREELKRFLNDKRRRAPCAKRRGPKSNGGERRERFNEEIAHHIASRWRDEGCDIGLLRTCLLARRWSNPNKEIRLCSITEVNKTKVTRTSRTAGNDDYCRRR